MIVYRINVLEQLKAAGYSTYKLRMDKIFGQATIQQLRNGQLVSLANLNDLCRLLNCQPGDIIEYRKEPEQ
jgi:putative transcriptional regulator